MLYDAAVVGTGPAGFSAALNFKIRNKQFLWIGSKSLSSNAAKAECILNYPGLAGISGEQLNGAFAKQAEQMGLEITGQMVNSIVPFSGHYALMAGSEFYEAKAIILATGTARKKQLPGEADFLGKGVSYCATCDGMLYRGKTIAVICGSARFEAEVEYLAALAGKIYYFPSFEGGTLNKDTAPSVFEWPDSEPARIEGDSRVTGIRLINGGLLETDGVFCLRDCVAYSALLPALHTENGHIPVDRAMATNLPGIYAAGDCTGRPYQYAKAVGEGNTAAHSVLEYLRQV